MNTQRLFHVVFALSLVFCTRPGATNSPEALPLQGTRPIQFTTTEGTWISLDVSPDGRRIVFDLLGDLYTVPINGGKATRISEGPAFDAQPRYSPDGSSIVFTSDRDGWVNVWIAEHDGTGARQVTRFHAGAGGDAGAPVVLSPEWLPDGTGIVVTERLHGLVGSERLVEYPAAGGRGSPITHVGYGGTSSINAFLRRDDIKDRVQYRGAAFGNDPRWVYAAAKPQNGTDEYWQIAKIDRESHRVVLETSPTSGLTGMRPLVSPNGQYLVFGAPTGDDTGLRVRDLWTNREWWLTSHAERTVASIVQGSWDSRDLLPGSSFTPDSRALITAYDGKIWRLDIDTGKASPVPFTADVDQQAGPLVRFEYPISDGSFTARAIRTPRLSPDGSKVVFTALDRLWMVDLVRHRLPSHGTSSEPSRGPITTADETTADSVRSMPWRLTTSDVGEFFPTWSPDGQYIAYVTWSDAEGGAVYRMRADGNSAPERLTREPGYYSKPVYTADGREVLAVRGWTDSFRAASSQAARAVLGPLQLVRVPASGGLIRVSAPYDVPEFNWEASAFVYSQPHVATDDDARVSVYSPEHGLVSIGIDRGDRLTLLKEVTTQPSAWPKTPVKEVLVSPSGRAALAMSARLDQDHLYLFAMPMLEASSPPSISLSDDRQTLSGVRVWRLSQMGVDFAGWTADDRPYYSVGNLLFVADQPLSTPLDMPPTFHPLTIDLQVPQDRAPGSLLLRGARLLTMRGQEIVQRGDLLVSNGRIAGVGPVGSLRVPADATIMDAAGTTILPGYVDVHDHVGHNVASGVHMTQEPRLLIDLAFGVTALRDPIGYGQDLMAYGERAAAGDLIAPRIFTMSTAIYGTAFGDGVDQDVAGTREVLSRWSKAYHSETIKQYLAGGRRTRQLIAMAAFEQGLTPTNEGAMDTAMELTMALDGYGAVEHRMPVAPLFRDVIELFARTGIIQTPTLGSALRFQPFLQQEEVADDPKVRRFFPPDNLAALMRRQTERQDLAWNSDAIVRRASAPAAQLMARGVCVALGSHGNIPGVGPHYELWYFAKGGMPLYDVLRAGTLCGARSIGHERDFGSLEPGKLADLQILEKNPLDDITNTRAIRYVMKDGRLFEAATLNEVWPRRKGLERLWWWAETAACAWP